MEIPKLERGQYSVNIDDVEFVFLEPTFQQMKEIYSLKDVKNIKEEKTYDRVVNIMVSLMDYYENSVEEKQEFIKKLSIRQLTLLMDGLANAINSKKVPLESEKSSS